MYTCIGRSPRLDQTQGYGPATGVVGNGIKCIDPAIVFQIISDSDPAVEVLGRSADKPEELVGLARSIGVVNGGVKSGFQDSERGPQSPGTPPVRVDESFINEEESLQRVEGQLGMNI